MLISLYDAKTGEELDFPLSQIEVEEVPQIGSTIIVRIDSFEDREDRRNWSFRVESVEHSLTIMGNEKYVHYASVYVSPRTPPQSGSRVDD